MVRDQALAKREKRALQQMDWHPNIVQFHGLCQDASFWLILLERCHLILAQLVEERGSLVDAGGVPDGVRLKHRPPL